MHLAAVANAFPYCVSAQLAQLSSPGVACIPMLTGPALSEVAIPWANPAAAALPGVEHWSPSERSHRVQKWAMYSAIPTSQLSFQRS